MSRTSTSGNDFDIWKFVACAKCRLPYEAGGSGPQMVPFWLTECGHIVCNNHIKADQSCPGCGLQQVQMTPLQRELPPPLADWFLSLPHVLDTIANSVKFQQEMLASLVIFYKNKSAHQRGVIDRVKGEMGELRALKKANEQLMAENEQLRHSLGYGHGHSASSVNSNGKRRMTDAYRSFSSPRSVTTPLGPNRLTLPRDHQQPTFGQRPNNDGNLGLGGAQGFLQPIDRPGSRRFAQQYAYAAQPPSRDPAQNFSDPSADTTRSGSSRAMPPPPPPIPGAHTSRSMPSAHEISGGQPHVPSHSFNFLPHSSVQQQQSTANVSSNRFTPRASTSQKASAPPSVPQTPSRRFVPSTSSGSRQASRAGHPNIRSSGNQRAPFVPGAQFG